MAFDFTDHETLSKLDQILRTHEQMRNMYWWNPPNTAAGRREFEKRCTHEEIAWTENGDRYTAATECTCSVKNIYYKGIFTRNGKKTKVDVIRRSYERMVEEIV